MRKYAVLKNLVVTEIVTLSEEEVRDFSKTVEQLIDVEEYSSNVVPGYILNGNKLEIPQNNSSREQFEIQLNDKKSRFGTDLARDAVNKIGARNKILNKNGAQVSALLNSLLSIKILLETGALGTARSICVQMASVYTEYADIFQHIVSEVNSFESSNGL